MFANFTVETNKDLTSKGSITNPAGKRCPSRLEPWVDFLEEQRVILGTLLSAFPARTEAFRSRHYLRTRGQVIAAKRVGDEYALGLVLQDLVAELVTSIVERFQEEDAVKAEFDIGAGIAFETRVNALICAYRRDDGDAAGRTMAYIIEHKAPHKLTLPHLRLGLRPMNIHEDVVNRPTIPPPRRGRSAL